MKKNKKFLFGLGTSLVLLASLNTCFAATGKVNIEALRIREKANTTSEVIDVAYKDDNVEIVGETGDWYKVKFNGNTGYASKEYITNKDSQTSSSKNNTTNNTNTNSDANTSNSSSNANATNTNNNNESTASSNSTSNSTSSQANEDEKNNTSNNSENVSNTESTSNNSNSENATDEDYTGKNVKLNKETNLKLLPTFSSNTISKIENGKEVKVIYDLKNWLKVEYNSNQGWIAKSIVSQNNESTQTANNTTDNSNNTTEKPAETNNTSEKENNSNVNKKGYINVETANVREKADKTSTLVNTLDEFDEVTIKAEKDSWYQIEAKGKTGYILKKLVTIGNVSSRGLAELRDTENQNTDTTNTNNENTNTEVNTQATNKTDTETSNSAKTESSNTTKGQEVVDYAKQFLGCKYVLGGKSPENGFDCSGFTKYVFKNFGYTLGSVAADQVSSGKEVSRSELKVGDLLLFYDEGKTKIGHVGIYMGNDEFIHAANSKRGVVTDTLSTNSYYNTRFVTARRIVE